MCESLLPCPLCSNRHFGSADKLRSDLISVATKKIFCPICNESVLGLDKLTIHLFTHSQNKSSKKPSNTDLWNAENNCEPDNKEPDVNSAKKNSIPSLKKKQIDKIDNTSNAIERKHASQHKRVRNLNNKCKTIPNLSENRKLVKICPKLPVYPLKTLSVLGLQENINNHFSPQNEYAVTVNKIQSTTSVVCNFCGINFVDENILNMHKSLVHNYVLTDSQNQHPFPCHLCSKAFNMKGSLMIHLRVAHYGIKNGNKRYKGNKLQEQPNSDANLQLTEYSGNAIVNSERTHSGEQQINKQWICDDCHKAFTTKYFLKKHKRLHTGETPYSCSQCGKTFTFQQSYHKHLLYHTNDKPHTCIQCGRSFKELSTLHNHERIHTGEKPFSCETCGKAFRQRVSYLVHKRIHTGVMPYKCTACEKSFRYKVSQRSHKCLAQPPGMVIRQTGDLIQKLINKNTDESVIRSVSSPTLNNGINQNINGNDSSTSQSHTNFSNVFFSDIVLSNVTQINNNISFGDELMDTSLTKWTFETSEHSMQNNTKLNCDLQELYACIDTKDITNSDLNSYIDPSTEERMKLLNLNGSLIKYDRNNTTLEDESSINTLNELNNYLK